LKAQRYAQICAVILVRRGIFKLSADLPNIDGFAMLKIEVNYLN